MAKDFCNDKIHFERENECRFSGQGSRRDTEAMVIICFLIGCSEGCIDKMMRAAS